MNSSDLMVCFSLNQTKTRGFMIRVRGRASRKFLPPAGDSIFQDKLNKKLGLKPVAVFFSEETDKSFYNHLEIIY
jgi:hypothetical protein